MGNQRARTATALLGLAFLSALAACQGGDRANVPAPPMQRATAPAAEELSLEGLYGILGQGEAENSGIFDLAKSEKELTVTYHFYEARKKGLEDRIGPDLAPKIQAFYRKFRTIDRVVFKVDVFERRDVLEWRPYCTFVTTRRLIDDIDWTGFLLKDFFKVVLELKYAE